MKGKSVAVQLITTVILAIGYFGSYFDAHTAAILAAVSYGLTAVLSTFAPSGTFVKGWNWVMWGVNIGGVLIQIANYSADAGLIAVNIAGGIVAAINILLQVYFTDKVNASVKVS